jgi:hypothetical protein
MTRSIAPRNGRINTKEGRQPMTEQKYLRSGLGFAVGRATEECGEFLAALGKTMRWGRDSVNPELPAEEQETNEAWLRREMADLRDALDNLEREMDAPRSFNDDMRMSQ